MIELNADEALTLTLCVPTDFRGDAAAGGAMRGRLTDAVLLLPDLPLSSDDATVEPRLCLDAEPGRECEGDP